MVEIIFRLPSKKVQYGYVEVRESVDTKLTPESLAEDYVDWVTRFAIAEDAAMEEALKPKQIQISDIVEKIEADDDSGNPVDVPDLLRRELGAHVVSDTPAPWDGQGDVPKNLEPKPWKKTKNEKKTAATKDNIPSFDFG